MIAFLFIFLLAMLYLLFILVGIGFKLTGALLAAVFWTLIEIPLGMVTMVLGMVLCGTIILIPLGLLCMKTGFRLLVPGI